MEIPNKIGGATVLRYSEIDSRHRHLNRCEHQLGGKIVGKASWVAICKDKDLFYLFFGYEGDVTTDTAHFSLDEAIRQAEFEYEGLGSTWEVVSS